MENDSYFTILLLQSCCCRAVARKPDRHQQGSEEIDYTYAKTVLPVFVLYILLANTKVPLDDD